VPKELTAVVGKDRDLAQSIEFSFELPTGNALDMESASRYDFKVDVPAF
jgi:hypothetical protein